MNDPRPNNNEFHAAEQELRKIGSNLWFGGLSDEWQDFLVSHTVECFDTYESSLPEAANLMISIYQVVVNAEPGMLHKDPWKIGLDVPDLLRQMEASAG